MTLDFGDGAGRGGHHAARPRANYTCVAGRRRHPSTASPSHFDLSPVRLPEAVLRPAQRFAYLLQKAVGRR
jgi:hypothetical protein